MQAYLLLQPLESTAWSYEDMLYQLHLYRTVAPELNELLPDPKVFQHVTSIHKEKLPYTKLLDVLTEFYGTKAQDELLSDAYDILRSVKPQPQLQDTFDFRDGHGPVPAHQHKNPDGSIGGWVADTAHVKDTATIKPDAQVYGKAEVSGNAEVSGHAWVYGNAKVYDKARVYNKAEVYDNSEVYDNAEVYDSAVVCGNAKVFGNAKIHGMVHISGTDHIKDRELA